MIYRLAIGVLTALAVAIIVPAQGHADPPTKCLTNTPKGKQVYVPCDLLNAGVVLYRSSSTRKMWRTGVAKAQALRVPRPRVLRARQVLRAP
jgi:hypothetical protein